MSGQTHDEIVEMLGAFALHAVDADEAVLVEAHLAECPKCRAELADHLEVAAALGNSGADAPDGLWDRIVSTLEESPPPMRLSLPRSGEAEVIPIASRRRTGGNRIVLAALGAAAAAVIGVLGVKVVQQDDQIDRVEQALGGDTLLRAANAALLHPDASRSTLATPDGAVHMDAVLLPDGSGFLMADELPGLGDDRTYQLWGQTGSGMISLGLLGANPDGVVPFRASGDVAALAITNEAATGTNQPSTAPLLLGRFA